ncbi:unnamed protein product, partial [Ectocarpus sp. 4 AP-2014]
SGRGWRPNLARRSRTSHYTRVVFLCRQLDLCVVPHASAEEKLMPSDTCGQGPATNPGFRERRRHRKPVSGLGRGGI